MLDKVRGKRGSIIREFSSTLVGEIINPIHRPGRAATVHGALGKLLGYSG